MVDAHASGACEETHGGSSPFIGRFKKIRKKKDVVLITPVVLSEQRRFTLRVSCLVRLAGSSTMQAESLHRQIFNTPSLWERAGVRVDKK